MTDEPGGDEGAIGGGTDGYPRGTDPDTDGYRADSDVDTDEFLSEALGSLAETWKGMKEGWWNEAGHETFLDYFLAEEKTRARMGLGSIYSKRKKRPRTGELPDATPPRGSRNRQVNVKLTDLGYQALVEAARVYGLQPSTLARLLVYRGALAVLENREG